MTSDSGRRTIAATIVALGMLFSTAAPEAVASPVKYVAQVAGTGYTAGRQPTLTLAGDTLTAFKMDMVPQQCAKAPPGGIESDDSFHFSLASPGHLTNGRFQFQATAISAYGQFVNGYELVGGVTVAGVVTTSVGAQRTVTGTVTLSGASDPFVSGCSGVWTFTAIPAVTRRDWGVPSKRTYVSYSATRHQGISFNYRAGVVSGLVIEDNFVCGGRTSNAAEVYASDYGFRDIRTTAHGAFAIHTYVFEEYGYIVKLDVTGTIAGKRATGNIRVSEPGPGYNMLGQAGEACSGNARFTATRPTPPGPPGPEAFFQWAAIRVPTGAGYRYYFAIVGLRCQDGATEVRLTVAGRSHIVSCSRVNAFASSALAPGRTYSGAAQAFEVKRGRVERSGEVISQPLQMPGAGDKWKPIRGNFGMPPV